MTTTQRLAETIPPELKTHPQWVGFKFKWVHTLEIRSKIAKMVIINVCFTVGSTAQVSLFKEQAHIVPRYLITAHMIK